MEAVSIASATISLLTPYLVEAGGKVAKEAISAAWEKAVEIHKLVKERVTKDDDKYSKETFERYEKEPEKRKLAMQEVLTEILEKDTHFSDNLVTLLEATDKSDAGTVFNTNIFGGKVGEIINVKTIEQDLNIDKRKK